MGVHYLNAALLGDPKLDLRKPELLLYEPQDGGGMKLVGVEWMVLDTGQRARRASWAGASTGRWTTTATAPMHYDLHVWTVRRNPRGTFSQYNPRVSCEAVSRARRRRRAAAAPARRRAPPTGSCESLFAK